MQAQQGQKKTSDNLTISSDNQDIGTWQNPEGAWGVTSSASSSNDIIVDTHDKEAWPSIGDQSETASDTGDTDSASVKNQSVISSSSNPGQTQVDSVLQSSSAIHLQSASSVWGGTNLNSNASEERIDSGAWGSNPGSASQINARGWDENPPASSVNNQGLMQSGQSIVSGSDNINSLNNRIPGGNWGMNNGQTNTMSGQEHGISSSGALTVSNGPSLTDSQSASNNAMSWQGINFSSAGLTGLQKEQAANSASAWGNVSVGNSVIGSGLGISTSSAGSYSMDNSKSMDQWGGSSSQSSSSSLGWNTPSSASQPEPSGWGSPCPSPNPGAGTEAWGAPDKNNPPQAWGQPNSNANSSTPTGWGQPEAKTTPPASAGWGDIPAESSSNTSSGWGQPPPKPAPSPSPWGQQSQTNQPQWGGGAAANPTQSQPSQWGAGGAASGANAPQTTSQAAWGSGTPVGSKAAPPPPPPQQSQPTSWAQAAGRGLYAQQQNKPPTPVNPTSQPVDPKDQFISQAVNSHDGWGKRPVRQDTSWEMEESPKLMQRRNSDTEIENPSSHWDNNKGTAIWEASKGNTGPPPPPNWDNGGGNRGASGGGSDWGRDNDSGHWNGPPGDNSSNQWNGPQQPSNQWGGRSSNWGGDRRDGSGDRTGGRDNSHWGGSGGGGSGGAGSSSSNSWDSNKSDSNTWGGGGKEDNVWDRNGTNAWGSNSKVETGMWCGNSQRRGSSSSWGDESIEPVGWDEHGEHSHMPQMPGHQRQNSTGSVDDGTAFWGDPNVHRPNNWNGQPSTPGVGPPRGPPPPDDKIGMWGGPVNSKPSNSWGDQKMDEGPFWAQNQPPQNKGWGDNQWSGVKPKTPSGSWGEPPDWAQQGRRGPPFMPGNGRQQPQMRSKLLQQLTEMGFKREDAQNALISNNMNMDSAIADLVQSAKTRHEFDMDGKRKIQGIQPDGMPDTQSDIGQFGPPVSNTPFAGNAQSQLTNSQVIANPLKPGVPSLQNPSSLSGIGQSSSISPSLQQKILQHQMAHQQIGGGLPQPQGQPIRGQLSSSAQTMLMQQTVQQLRMAIQAGLISPKLLNQELTPNLRVMLHQLLQFLETHKQLVAQQQLLQQHLIQQKQQNPVMAHQLERQLEQVTLTVQHIKQQMARLQQQMAQAQTSLPKQMPGNDAQGMSKPPGSDPATGIKADLLKDLTSHMSGLNLSNKDAYPQQSAQSQSGSRLTQWKLPSPEKESSSDLNKAPGSKPLGAAHSAPNLQNKLETSAPSSLPFSDSTWSTLTSASTSTGSWPSTSAISTASSTITASQEGGHQKESPITSDASSGKALDDLSVSTSIATSTPSSTSPGGTSNQSGININDMIEEFVPGKRWQGITIKSVEDDPYATPGSIQRPSLSVNTIKDDYVMTTLGKSTSPTPSESALGSTWGTSLGGLGKTSIVGAGTRSSWSSSSSSLAEQSLGSELWGIPQGAKNTRPPPGLTNQKQPGSNWQSGGAGFNRSVSWAPGDRSSFSTMSNAWSGGQQGASNCLLLKNLTPQIDGSTLRTLCQQHGPLQAFYLNLGYGQAIVRYGTKDEAAKAQVSLNSCVLGNTTIAADFVSDVDAARLLEQLNAQGSSASGGQHSGLMRATSEAGVKDSSQWNGASTVWSSGGGIGSGGGVGASSLWDGTPGLDEHHSLLPGDLLSGQSM